MRRVFFACLLFLVLPGTAAADTSERSAGARASVTSGTATLTNGHITRSWDTAGGVTTTVLRRGRHGANWSDGSSPDFELTLDGVPTSSTTGWTLTGVIARKEPFDPSRPDRDRGVQLVFG